MNSHQRNDSRNNLFHSSGYGDSITAKQDDMQAKSVKYYVRGSDPICIYESVGTENQYNNSWVCKCCQQLYTTRPNKIDACILTYITSKTIERKEERWHNYTYWKSTENTNYKQIETESPLLVIFWGSVNFVKNSRNPDFRAQFVKNRSYVCMYVCYVL